jgi:serine/threonine protein kinase
MNKEIVVFTEYLKGGELTKFIEHYGKIDESRAKVIIK